MPFDYGTKKEDGQFERHPTQVPEDRKFIRPVRNSYKHIGISGPKFLPLRDLTEEEKTQYNQYEYVKFEEYPESKSPVLGKYWTQKQLDSIGKGCGVVTRMGQSIAETYAANPSFYGSTFCSGCGNYFPVGDHGEFVWIEKDGTEKNERVGT